MSERSEAPRTATAVSEATTGPVHRNSWGAIFGGMFIALAIMITLDLLSLAIGLTVLNPVEGANTTNWGIGAAIWWIVAAWIGFYFGGMFAGWMSGFPRAIDAVTHGFAVWAFTVVVMIFAVSTSIGAIAGGALGLARTAAEAGGTSVATNPPMFQSPSTALEARAYVTPAVDITMDTTAPTRQQAETARKVGAGTAWAAFIMFIVGAGLSALGAYNGRSDYTLGWPYGTRRTEKESKE